MPPKGSSNPLEWYGYSFVWCELRQSFLIFGGGGDVGPYFYEFNPIIGAWTEVPLIGDVPPRVKSACFIPAYNGTRMVLFGGLTNSSAAVGGIYFLNISSMAWTLGQAVPSEQNRFGMACAVSGDNFIIWGGQGVTSEGTVKSGTPLIYNMYTSNWTTQFEGSTDKTKITNDNVYGRQTRPFGSHSNARLATFAPQIDNGGSTNQIFSVHDSNIIRPLSTAPISTSELPNHTSHYDSASQCIAESMAQTNSSWPPPQLPTNPSWHSTPPSTSTWPSTPPTNPSWPNTSDEEPFAPLSYHSPSSLSVTPSAPLESRTPSSLRYNIHSPSAPPPSYLDSMSTPQNTVFRDETVTEQPRSLHLESLEELYGMHTNGHNVHEQQIEKIEHQLAASKKELDRRSIGLHSYQDSLSPAIYVATVGIPETSTWNSHETRDTIVQGLSNGSSSNSGGDDNNNRNGMSNEELKHQIIALQAELTRLQAMIDQSERK
ncbi:hypothetical protein FBU30_010513 [Linnemannia zychae]|nr:hypothetical protein FBU30_010513 [Linnemannia zychae]